MRIRLLLTQPFAILAAMKCAIPYLAGTLLLATSAPVALADELRLKDGTTIVGNIVGYEGDSFKVETSYGFALVRKDKVASIVISEVKPEAKSKPAAPPAEAPKSANIPPPAGTTPKLAQIPTAAPAKAAPQPPPPAKSADKTSTAPAPAQKATVAPEPMREEVEGNLYRNLTYSFQLYKPPSWQVIEGARKTLPTAIVVMGTADETTLFIVGREPLRLSLEQHAATTERRLRELYVNYSPLGDRRTVVAGQPALEKRFRGMVDEHEWSVTVLTFVREKDVFTLIGMTYADSDLIQIQENVIARTIASLEFTK